MNGACVEDLPANDDPYRCVGLEWRQSGPGTYHVGDVVPLSLYAVADGCNMPSSGCPLGGHPIWHIYTILEWDPAVLQLQTPTTGNPNPADPCDDVNFAVACPANAYNWFTRDFRMIAATTSSINPATDSHRMTAMRIICRPHTRRARQSRWHVPLLRVSR